MVRVTLTNHRRLYLFPTDYALRHTVVTVNLTSRTRVVSSPGERDRQQSFFSEFPSFHIGNKDLKPRTGSWRIAKILAKRLTTTNPYVSQQETDRNSVTAR